MEFTLFYRGKLKTNRGPKEKHVLRRHFHKQLAVLWGQKPLLSFYDTLINKERKDQSINIVQEINDFSFAPLIANKIGLICELDITLLRPETTGSIFTNSGDIDNRLKTLFDALKLPKSSGELPSDLKPSEDENPFYCLVEDDSLITHISVKTEQLLDCREKSSEVVLLIHVTTKQIFKLYGTRHFP